MTDKKGTANLHLIYTTGRDRVNNLPAEVQTTDNSHQTTNTKGAETKTMDLILRKPKFVTRRERPKRGKHIAVAEVCARKGPNLSAQGYGADSFPGSVGHMVASAPGRVMQCK